MAWFIEGLETDQDRTNEIAVLEYVKLKTGLDYIQTKKLTRYDAELYKNGKLFAIAEIKCRKNCNHDTYKTAIIRTDKWNACNKIAEDKGLKFILLFRYDDGVFMIEGTHKVFIQHNGGCYVNVIRPWNNPHDEEEEVLNIPYKLLTKV